MEFFDTTSVTDDTIQNTYYPGMASNADGIDLRIEMNRMLYGTTFKKPLGHWVVIRLFDRSTKSDYFNVYTKEGIMGPAHKFEDILVRGRRVPTRITRSSVDETKTADVTKNGYQYYFEWDIPIKDGDQIFELDLPDHTTKPTSYTLKEKYDVSRVHGFRLENGNIQYMTAMAAYNNITY